MKLVNADKAYGVLDRLFSQIQKTNYVTSQDVLDQAWKTWCELKTDYDVDKVVEQLSISEFDLDEKPHVVLNEVISIVKGAVKDE